MIPLAVTKHRQHNAFCDRHAISVVGSGNTRVHQHHAIAEGTQPQASTSIAKVLPGRRINRQSGPASNLKLLGRRSREMRASLRGAASIATVVGVSSVVILAGGEAAAGSADWIDWNEANFLGPCQGDCGVSLSGGRQNTTGLAQIMLIQYPVPPWERHWGDAGIVDGEFSRRLVTFWHALDIEPQTGIGKRFGDMQAVEFWGAIAFRYCFSVEQLCQDDSCNFGGYQSGDTSRDGRAREPPPSTPDRYF
jgi:hypothetical protein